MELRFLLVLTIFIVSLSSSQDDSCARCVPVDRALHECPKAIEIIKVQRKYPEICKRSGGITYLCCYPRQSVRQTTVRTTFGRPVFSAGNTFRPNRRPIPKPTSRPRIPTRPRVTSQPSTLRPRIPTRPRVTTRRPPTRRPPTRRPPTRPPQTRKCGETVFHKIPGSVGVLIKRTLISETSDTHQSFIIGGNDAEPKEFPWAVRIGRTNFGRIDWMCGGTLITNRHVLTAAHCFNHYTGDNRRITPFIARMGELDVTTTQDSDHVDRRISRIFFHPYYIGHAYHDIAILVLEFPVIFNDYINVACLPSPKLPLKFGTVIGWGATGKGKTSDVLQELDVDIVNGADCNTILSSLTQFSFLVPRYVPDGVNASIICAGREETGKDSCKGDSGSGLFVQSGSSAAFFVAGVVSSGIACGQGNPSFYTNVSTYMSWINSIIRN